MTLLKTGDQPPRGPNLLGKAGTAASPPDGHRILSRLEHGATATAAALPAARWRPGWWHWAAGAAGLAVLGLALLANDTASLPVPESPPAPAAARVAASATAALPAALPAVAPRAATIVNDAGPIPPPAANATSPAASASAPRKAPPPLRQAATRAPAPVSRQAATAPGDSDVALLTAMVAHAHRQEGMAAPVRDVVLRKEEEETASLLRRCRQLGMIEGMLCRSRICSGRWDSDPACR